MNLTCTDAPYTRLRTVSSYGIHTVYLVISVHPVLCSILVVDVEGTLRGVDGQHVIVRANPIPLRILV